MDTRIKIDVVTGPEDVDTDVTSESRVRSSEGLSTVEVDGFIIRETYRTVTLDKDRNQPFKSKMGWSPRRRITTE